MHKVGTNKLRCFLVTATLLLTFKEGAKATFWDRDNENGLRGGIKIRDQWSQPIELNDLKPESAPIFQEIKGSSFELDGEMISLKDTDLEAFEDPFTADATFMINDEIKEHRPPSALFRTKDKKTIIAKDGNRLHWALKNEPNGKTKEVVPVREGSPIFATLSSDDIDADVLGNKFRYGESVVVPANGPRRAELLTSQQIPSLRSLEGKCINKAIVQVAIAFDSTYCAKFKYNSTAASIAATEVVAAASKLYSPLCIGIKNLTWKDGATVKAPTIAW